MPTDRPLHPPLLPYSPPLQRPTPLLSPLQSLPLSRSARLENSSSPSRATSPNASPLRSLNRKDRILEEHQVNILISLTIPKIFVSKLPPPPLLGEDLHPLLERRSLVPRVRRSFRRLVRERILVSSILKVRFRLDRDTRGTLLGVLPPPLPPSLLRPEMEMEEEEIIENQASSQSSTLPLPLTLPHPLLPPLILPRLFRLSPLLSLLRLEDGCLLRPIPRREEE